LFSKGEREREREREGEIMTSFVTKACFYF